MEDGSFGYTVERSVVRFFGADAISVSHAVYTFLEDAGYVFDFYGSFAPAEVKLDSLTGRTVRPRARYRGIRQHVNFPMDISSYPIDEAKAYLDQLLRMRFNKLSIHDIYVKIVNFRCF